MDQAILCLDNGAHSIKAIWSNAPASEQPATFRNAITRSKTERRSYVGDELDECMDFGGLVFRLPCERGIVTNWEVQKTIWDRVLGNKGRGLKVDPSETRLLITEPVFNLPNVQDHYDQMLFEEYDFAACLRCPGPSLVAFGAEARGSDDRGSAPPECVLVVDSGFSFTHVVPVLRGAVISQGVRRIDIGGKLLTNHLKELVSFRQWYMMDQTSVIERVKETCCYVSERWEEDLMTANSSDKSNSIVRTYVLPDFVPTSSNKLGFVRPVPVSVPADSTPSLPPAAPVDGGKGKGKEKLDATAGGGGEGGGGAATTPALPAEEEQLLHMSNERFTVPEVLFNPSAIGLNQAGLAESIAHSIASLPEEVRGMFWANVVCVGGNTGFPGFKGRLERDLRRYAPEEYAVHVRLSESPTLATVLAAPSALATNPRLPDLFLSRAEYQEGGSNAARRKFGALYLGEKALRDEIGLGGA